MLSQQDFEVVVVSDEKSILRLFSEKHIDFVLIEENQINVSINELVCTLRTHASNVFLPVIILVSAEDEDLLSECILAGCDDYLFKPFTVTTLKARFSALDNIRELKQLHKNSISEQLVARQILAYALSERNIKFDEVQIFSKSKEIFNGDLFLAANCPDGGVHILLADFTGHGLSAAIGALPVADIFSVMSNEGFALDAILENINNKLYTLLPVCMFMACSVLKIQANLKRVSAWNGGMPDVYIRDSQTGEIKSKIKSSHIPLGIDEKTNNSFKLNTIAINDKDQFILYTDGLIEAENINGDMFGYQNLDKCLDNNREKELVFTNIVAYFNNFCGDIEPNDDVTLICIPCRENMTEVKEFDHVNIMKSTSNHDNDWL